MKSLYHGLSAYNREGTESDDLLWKKATIAERACCSWSDLPIGPLGLFADYDSIIWVDGGCHHDCYSSIDENGYRYSNHQDYQDWDGAGFVDHRDFMEHISEKVDRGAKNFAYRYAEFFVVSEADAVWVRASFGERFVELAERLAENMRLPLFFV